MSGMDSGNTASACRSCRLCSTAFSAVSDLRLLRWSNTISKAMAKSSRPPATRKAGTEMPRRFSTVWPLKKKTKRMAPAVSVARTATRRRSAAETPEVSARNMGASPTGSMVTKSVANAFRMNSIKTIPPKDSGDHVLLYSSASGHFARMLPHSFPGAVNCRCKSLKGMGNI